MSNTNPYEIGGDIYNDSIILLEFYINGALTGSDISKSDFENIIENVSTSTNHEVESGAIVYSIHKSKIIEISESYIKENEYIIIDNS
jgi:hypothetical protein